VAIILYRDFETRSTLNLAKAGAWRYAADPTTEVLCVAFAIDDGPVQLWTPDMAVPVFDPECLIVSHNDQFESAIEARLLAPRYGWPVIPIERHRCTMARALAAALPGRLDAAAAALGIEIRKDTAGHRLMMAMSKPRRARQGEDKSIVHWHDDPERRRRLADYCKRDVEVERELYRRLPPLSEQEQRLWELDAIINARGFAVDRELAEATRATVVAEQAAIDVEIADLTGGAVTSINQVAKLQAWLQEHGHDVASISKSSVAALLADQPAPEIAHVLKLRREGGRAAARKLDALLSGTDADGRLRGCFRFHGAATGRWSGSRFQPQNLKKPEIKDLDAAVGAISAGDREQLRKIGSPLAIAGDISRNMITAAPGHILIGADFAAIESRVLAWLSGETWKLDNYREFDRTNNPTLEPYCVTASRILGRTVTPDNAADRQIGKTADLALGYGGGVGAWRRFAPDDSRQDVVIKSTVESWRSSHSKIVDFWRALERAAHRCVYNKTPQQCGAIAFSLRDKALLMTLPSGRNLSYPAAGLKTGKFDVVQVTFKDNAKGGFLDHTAWHGTFIENAVQAISRDLMAAAMIRLEAAGYSIVLHCHDEIVAEVAHDFGNGDEFLQLMTTLPDWATGLPLAAKVWRRQCYAKSESEGKGMPGENATKQQKKPYDHISLIDLIGEELTNGKMLCPFHDDASPSLHIYPDHYHCYTGGCEAHGDHIDWLMAKEEMTREAAIEFLDNWNGATVTPIDRVARDSNMLARAKQIWDGAKPIGGTKAVEYLKMRGIDIAALPTDSETLRFHPACPFESGKRVPCLIAYYSDIADGMFAGIHRIALTEDTETKVQRLTLGSWPKPRAIKLWDAGDQLYVGEGIETVLAAATKLKHQGHPMRPAWAMGSAHGLGKLPAIDTVKTLNILVDNDDAGKTAADRCVENWRRHDVIALMPDQPGADFNDVVLKDLTWSEETGGAHKNFKRPPLTPNEWRTRKLPPVDKLMGHVFTTTSRCLLSADTGLGKTNLCMAIAICMAAKKDFLHWQAHRPAKVLYIDGEMSPELFQERVDDAARRIDDSPDTANFLSLTDLDNFPPLNSPDGSGVAKLNQLIADLDGFDFIFFDNIMALTTGDQKDEMVWNAMLSLINSLTKRRIGQCWINHTGHDATRSYGSKTKDWRMDTTIHLTKIERPETDVCFRMEFRKARGRTPKNRADFQDVMIALVEDKWVGSVEQKKREKPSSQENRMLEVLDQLARGPEGQDFNGHRAVHSDKWKTECIRRGFVNKNAFFSYRARLATKNLIECDEDMAWRA
jgi:AAA domain/DNA polymerase family A/Toprim domain/CHC2 zinc finger